MRLSDIIKKTTQPAANKPQDPQEATSPQPQEKPFEFPRMQKKTVPEQVQETTAEKPSGETGKTPLDAENIYSKAIVEIKDILTNWSKAKESPKDIKSVPLMINLLSTEPEGLVFLTSKSTPDTHLYGHTVNITILSLLHGMGMQQELNSLMNLGYCAFCLDLYLLKKSGVQFKAGNISAEDMAQLKKLLPNDLDSLNRTADLLENIKIYMLSVITEIKSKKLPGYDAENIRGEDIEAFSQILALAHLYDSLIHPVNSTEKFIPHEAIKLVIGKTEGIFNPDMVKSFVKMISIYPVSSYIKLNTNEIGRVTGLNRDMPTRPRVSVILDSGLQRLPQPKAIDLSASPMLFIKEAVDETKLAIADKKLALELKAMKWWVKGL